MVWVWILTFLFTIPDTTPLGLLLLCEIEIQYFHEMKVSLKGKVPRNMYDPEMTLSMLQEGGCLPGSEKGFLSNTWKWMVWEHTHVDKRLYCEGAPGREQQGKWTREHCSATWLTVLGFMVLGLVSGLSLARCFDLGSFLVAHAEQNQNFPYHKAEWSSQVIAQNTKYKTNRQSYPNQTPLKTRLQSLRKSSTSMVTGL